MSQWPFFVYVRVCVGVCMYMYVLYILHIIEGPGAGRECRGTIGCRSDGAGMRPRKDWVRVET